MQGIIEVVSATGKGFRIEGQPKGEWYNKGKMLKDGLISGLIKGDEVSFDAPDGKWVTSLKKLGATAPASGLEAAAKVFAPSAPASEARKSDAQARGCAAHAVLESPYMGELLKGGSMEETVNNLKEMMEKISEFVYGGKW